MTQAERIELYEIIETLDYWKDASNVSTKVKLIALDNATSELSSLLWKIRKKTG